MRHLEEIKQRLLEKENSYREASYTVPGLWFDSNLKNPPAKAQFNPCSFFLRQIDSILQSPRGPLVEGENGEWSRRAVVFNAFVRLFSAYDHNQNGVLDFPINELGFRETGTFLKTIALMPHIKRLGCNTLHLLPITSIGEAHKKGTLGSPYAARNLYELDPNLSEPFLGMGAEEEFKALVEAAHHLGIRVVLEFVFRTSARDSDWVGEHPDWFYWIKEEIADRPHSSRDETLYGSPLFDPDVLTKIFDKVKREEFANTIPPGLQYRNMFTVPPSKGGVHREGNVWVGLLPENVRVKVAGAFSDWPPADTQPPWEDVTYLKLYRHPDFNYIAYNTVRMYDSSLACEKNRNEELWKSLENVIPHYQEKFRIDGVMIDMGHALPPDLLKKIVRRARARDPDFAFWEENFNLSLKSKEQGYNAAIGYLWAVEHHPHKLKELFQRFEKESFPVPFFGTSESHNSPRSAARWGGVLFSKFVWTLNNFLPVIPTLHNGFELGEEIPVNTGLDFTTEEIAMYHASTLPLFSALALNWENQNQIRDFVIKVAEIRNRYHGLIQNSNPASFRLLQFEQGGVFAFERKNSVDRLVILGNANLENSAWIKLFLHQNISEVSDILYGRKFSVHNGEVQMTLEPGEILVFDAGN